MINWKTEDNWYWLKFIKSTQKMFNDNNNFDSDKVNLFILLKNILKLKKK